MHVLSYCAVLNLDFMFIHKIKKKISYEYTCIQNFHVFSFCNKNKSYFYCKKKYSIYIYWYMYAMII
jgi:hypothetical protein